MPSDYDKIRNDNIREYGEGTRHLSFLGRLYTDRTHFIFELLQNAEDAGASKVFFHLFEDKLEIFHNGKYFNEDKDDVRGICGVGEGTKAEDLTQIGKFGIGFKSVYAYTTTPEIYSGDENFRIENYVRPYAIEKRNIDDSWTTLFVFPFNKDEEQPAIACREISTRLRNLSARTLLFLHKIQEVEYRLPDGVNGIYLRDENNLGSSKEITVIGQSNGEEENEVWLLFGRSVKVPKSGDKDPNHVSVELAFRLKKNEKSHQEEVVRIKDSPLVVFFPTEKETRFGFLIQGPYRTTPSRDNIPKDNELNSTLIRETASLIAEVLPQLKDKGLLNVSLLEALPIRIDDFSSDSMFYPIVEAVQEAFLSKELLPADDGTFVSARNSKLASADWLRKLLRQDQLKLLYQGKPKWIHGDISEKKHDLWKYLREELKIETLTPDGLARKIDSSFFDNQTDQWMIDFYIQLPNQKALWKGGGGRYRDPDGPLRKKPFIRLQDGSHVRPFDDEEKPNAYLPAKTTVDSQLPTVKATIAYHGDVRLFLVSDLKIPEFDIVAEVIEHVLPKYTSLNPPQKVEHLRDIEKIVIAFQTDSQEKQKRLTNALNETPFVLSRSLISGDKVFRSPVSLYFRNDVLEMYFSKNPDAAFVSSIYERSALDMLARLGVSHKARIHKRDKNFRGHIRIKAYHGLHERGLNGFDPDIKVDGLLFAVQTPTIEKSLYIWNEIVIPNAECIRGTIEKSSRQHFENSTKEEQVSEFFGRLLIENKWLPGPNGQFYKPSELGIDDLSEMFERNTTLANLLGMKKTEEVIAVDILSGGNSRKKGLIETIFKATDDELKKFEKLIPKQSAPPPPPSFKDGLSNLIRQQHGQSITPKKFEDVQEIHSVKNPERYQDKGDEAVANDLNEYMNTPQTICFSPIRIKPDNKEAREFLYNEYHGQCQITGATFPKARANAQGIPENYFEVCCLLSYSNADYLNNAGNMLCVSADTMAKLKHASFDWLENIEDKIAEFENMSGKAQCVGIKIKLAGEECTITWSQRHFMKFVSLYTQT